MALRKSAFMLVLTMGAAVAVAQEPQPPQPPPPPPHEQQPDQPEPPAEPAAQPTPPPAPSEPETTSTREIAAEVVSTDPAAKSINVKVMIKKDPSAQAELKEATMRVDDEATPALGSVSPGDQVKLLCRMSGNKVIAVKGIKTTGSDAPATQDEVKPSPPPQP